MTVFVALLRAVNVGGAGKLLMDDLKALCEDAGFSGVRTYIASGNVVFRSDSAEAEARAALQERLHRHMGAPVGVMIRTATDLAAMVAANPFPDAPGNTVAALLLNEAPPPGALAAIRGQADEEVALGQREIFVRYGAAGMGRSKLVIPAAKLATARNMNTLSKLARLAAAP